MSSKILINAVDSEECRIAKVKDSQLEEFQIESASIEITQGNIYKAIITRIEPSLRPSLSITAPSATVFCRSRKSMPTIIMTPTAPPMISATL